MDKLGGGAAAGAGVAASPDDKAAKTGIHVDLGQVGVAGELGGGGLLQAAHQRHQQDDRCRPNHHAQRRQKHPPALALDILADKFDQFNKRHDILMRRLTEPGWWSV